MWAIEAVSISAEAYKGFETGKKTEINKSLGKIHTVSFITLLVVVIVVVVAVVNTRQQKERKTKYDFKSQVERLFVTDCDAHDNILLLLLLLVCVN